MYLRHDKVVIQKWMRKSIYHFVLCWYLNSIFLPSDKDEQATTLELIYKIGKIARSLQYFEQFDPVLVKNNSFFRVSFVIAFTISE